MFSEAATSIIVLDRYRDRLMEAKAHRLTRNDRVKDRARRIRRDVKRTADPLTPLPVAASGAFEQPVRVSCP
jgi:hypothetical protein